MGKLIPLLFAGAGTATASVGGFYLVKSGGHHISDGDRSMVGAEDSSDPTQTAPSDTASDTLGFATLQEFKSGKGGVCAKRLFGSSGIDFENQGELIDGSKKLSDTEFTSAESTSSSAQSCLVVDWEKTNYSVDSDTKWKGHFRWSWSFVNGNKGFIMFVTTARDSLTLEGGFYLLGNSSDSWKITKHKELASSVKITKDNLESRIPKKGNILALDDSGDSTVDFWGFVSGPEDIEKFCTQNDNCTSTSTGLSPLEKSWMWKLDSTSTGNKLIDWTGNFENWLEGLFVKEQLQLKTSLSSFTGTWKPFSSTVPA